MKKEQNRDQLKKGHRIHNSLERFLYEAHDTLTIRQGTISVKEGSCLEHYWRPRPCGSAPKPRSPERRQSAMCAVHTFSWCSDQIAVKLSQRYRFHLALSVALLLMVMWPSALVCVSTGETPENSAPVSFVESTRWHTMSCTQHTVISKFLKVEAPVRRLERSIEV